MDASLRAIAGTCATLGLPALGLLFAAGDCRGVVVGDPIDFVGKLCSTLDSCYPGSHTCDAASADVSDETWAAFLGEVPDTCLDSCPDARACADAPPFCSTDPNASCTTEQDCCGWSQGKSACDGSTCCLPNGIACGAEDHCCTSECSDGYCGGFACVEIDGDCQTSMQCCSGQCVDEHCVLRTCSDLDETCMTDEDCCPLPFGTGEVVKPTCDEGSCKVGGTDPSCRDSGATCADSLPCCEGLDCIMNTTGGNCGDPMCIPEGDHCGDGEDKCCEPLVCDPAANTCVPAIGCTPHGLSCENGPDCCDMDIGCRNDGLCCPDYQCHSPCVPGPPLQRTCGNTDLIHMCIDLVLMALPSCDCDWKDACVTAAQAAGCCPSPI